MGRKKQSIENSNTVTLPGLLDLMLQDGRTAGLTREQLEGVLYCAMERIMEAVAYGKAIKINDFGVLAVKDSATRSFNSPIHGPCVVPAKRRASFKPADLFNETCDAVLNGRISLTGLGCWQQHEPPARTSG